MLVGEEGFQLSSWEVSPLLLCKRGLRVLLWFPPGWPHTEAFIAAETSFTHVLNLARYERSSTIRSLGRSPRETEDNILLKIETWGEDEEEHESVFTAFLFSLPSLQSSRQFIITDSTHLYWAATKHSHVSLMRVFRYHMHAASE